MTLSRNCGQLVGNKIQIGINYIEPTSGQRTIRLGSAEDYRDVNLVEFDGYAPQVDPLSLRVLSAAAYARNGTPALAGISGGYRSGIIRCVARDIDLPFVPIAAPLKTRWAGLEEIKPFARAGHPNNLMVRDEIAVVKSGEKVIVLDQKGSIGEFSWNGNYFSEILPVTIDRLIIFLRSYGASAKSYLPARWAWESLGDLGMQHRAPEVEARLAQLSKQNIAHAPRDPSRSRGAILLVQS